ncbi:3-hydroxyacyl-CoA dehydrogenase NAD-binding domain-containing protein [Parapedobacter soli]|uniref:3-hydroxyacyl-CoA dehydrogenase NAD-binding domain-containing protein n=1 Tax=Parapedobacter soli TaxID=416955 RepID=UPI0021C8B9CD|nr:3-hydroxyacyl-CoA dehydrogenase NAD-binding domain-containing protein [Parapedobacter soli]
MNKPKDTQDRVFLVGDGEPTYRVAGMMANAGQEVVLLTIDPTAASVAIERCSSPSACSLTLLTDWPDAIPCDLAVAITPEQPAAKRNIIQQLACRLDDDAIIAINTESVSLEELQAGNPRPERILGLNWCYPANLTFFLEIIANAMSDAKSIDRLVTMGRERWGKDPYTIHSGFSARARMMAAWAREAIHLVEQGYASMESIDRACRNDAGHYLPFAGNFRYMDLMGTYAYGMVMKDLNPDLAQLTTVPEKLAEELVAYAVSGSAEREAAFQRFSEEIRALILKYPHPYETLDR